MTSVSRASLLAAALVAVFLLGALALQWTFTRQLREVEASPTALSRPAEASVPDAKLARELERLRRVQTSMFAATLVLALLLGSVPVAMALISSRRSSPDTRAPWRAEAAGLEQFARLTVERAAALEREHGARIRAEQDLHISRSLLDRSLEERVRLGRELHDNVSQTLYGVTLALESVRKNMTAAPAIEQRLEHCLGELRRLNQEVRTYLRDLEPATVQSESLSQALASTLHAATASSGVEIEQRLDSDVLALVPPQHAFDVVNLVREAVSNSVRHGRARRISVRAARGERALALAISDDGAGFTPAPTTPTGHGLGNMHARAAALGGVLQIESAPGKGTRVLLTLPLDSTSA